MTGRRAPRSRRDPDGPGAAEPRPAAERALAVLLEADWEWRLREFPDFATMVGDVRYDDRWTDLSLEAFDRRADYQRDLLRRAEAIEAKALGPAARENHALFLHETRLHVEGLRFRDELMPLTQLHGVHQDVADLLQMAPRRTLLDFEHVTARLRSVGRLVDQALTLMREGARTGLTPPRVVLTSVPALIANQIADDPEASPISRMLLGDLPPDLDAAARQRVRRDILSAVEEVVVPAYRRLHDFVTADYLPRTRTSLGLTALPDGEDWYRHLIRVMTSSDLPPRAIHELGLEEVARIRAAMLETMTAAGFQGSLEAFFEYLRTDARFFYTDAEQLLVGYRDICKRLDAALPRLFRTLPRLPYGVLPVPAYSEKAQTTAYYYPGSTEAGRPGYFFANTYDLRSRPRWEMEALAAHEAVPGHHLQISLAQELSDLPGFRRHGHHTAFVEGWGLYSESLGAELGLYRDPYSNFGRLTYEMWRAIRLVVDPGLHVLGWTREQAIRCFEENAGKAGHDIAIEVDRYISWPAQALAYKLGELTLRRLREQARATLGERFDIRDFHDVVLLAGPLPLPFLEERVAGFIAAGTRPAARRA
ncbi:MAG TPA: DUF885 domain-containing protein [Candidatus Cryosericum sp.]|nr:DUF885 domain-containing protein [Candidatus Cryosericum sp.]